MKLSDIRKHETYLSGNIKNDVEQEGAMEYVLRCYNMFLKGDFGCMPPEDIEANKEELEGGAGRVLAKYPAGHGIKEAFYILADFNQEHPGTEWNHITIFYCSDY